MKIAIEAQRIFRTNKHGMDFVALESIRELQKIDKENEYFIFVFILSYYNLYVVFLFLRYSVRLALSYKFTHRTFFCHDRINAQRSAIQ